MSSIDKFFNSPMIEKFQQQQKIIEKILMPSKVIADSMNRATIAAQQAAFIQPNSWNTVQKISEAIMSTPIAPNLAAYQQMSTTSYLAQLAPIIGQEVGYSKALSLHHQINLPNWINSITTEELKVFFDAYEESLDYVNSNTEDMTTLPIDAEIKTEIESDINKGILNHFDFLTDLSNSEKINFIMWLIGIVITINVLIIQHNDAEIAHQDAMQAHQDATQAHQDFLLQQSTSKNNNETTNIQPTNDK